MYIYIHIYIYIYIDMYVCACMCLCTMHVHRLRHEHTDAHTDAHGFMANLYVRLASDREGERRTGAGCQTLPGLVGCPPARRAFSSPRVFRSLSFHCRRSGISVSLLRFSPALCRGRLRELHDKPLTSSRMVNTQFFIVATNPCANSTACSSDVCDNQSMS